jgi:glycosyltransferase involved in cell wall biosynthesis
LYRERDCSRPFPRPGQKIRILCFAAAYSHKRLHFLPDVARQLEIQDPQLDFEFVITLPTDSSMLREVERKAARYGVSTRIKNEGRIAVADGPQLYAGCDICFMPTVLETFSATYPEAMAMGLPIVATDLGFATDVCRDAALYFHPTSAREAADRILQLLRSESLWSQCIARGKAVLQQFPTPRQKFEAYLRILCDLVGRSHTPQPALSA